MESIKELQSLLLATPPQPLFSNTPDGAALQRIVVLKHYRFHKALNIELFDAPTTASGKLKNPLTPVNPLDAVLAATDPAVMLFYTSISRFQNNPTAVKTGADITALKAVIKNPASFRFFYHDAGFSEKVVAGALQEIQVGPVLNGFSLVVDKTDVYYEVVPQLVLNGTLFRGRPDLRYDFFLHHEGTLHLAPSLQVMKLLQFFAGGQRLRVHEKSFTEFRQTVLGPMEEQTEIVYSFVPPATHQQLEAEGLRGAEERILYLSEMGQYVLLTPVIRYGPAEVPVRSKKPVHVPDGRGGVMALARNGKGEDNFLSMLVRQHSLFFEQLEEEFPYLYLHRDRFLDEDWFLHAFAQWRDAGITIFGFNQLKGNKLNAHAAQISVAVLSGLNWFNVHLDVRFGKKKASNKQLQQAIRNKSKYVQLDDGTLGILPIDWLERIGQFFNAGEVAGEELIVPKAAFATVTQLFKEAELDEEVKQEVALLQQQLANFAGIAPVAPPEGLKATLRPYQQTGLNWLYFLHQHGLGGCLADDMGLGKTLQVIALLQLLKENGTGGTHLVVAPTSLLFNWQAELHRFAPALRVLALHGSGREKDYRVFAQYDVVVTTYGTLLSDIDRLRRFVFHHVLLDESQSIKNIQSQRYHAVRLLQSRNRLVITGTPVENNTLDLYAQLSFACPGLLGNKQNFKDLFAIPIDRFQSSSNLRHLQQKVAPFVLRRTKQEVASELPEKTEMVLYCPMEEAQRRVYDAYEKDLRDYLEGMPQDDVLRNSMHVLRGLTQLRQICDAPALLAAENLQGEGSAKIAVLIDQIETRAPVHKILVFSQFVGMLQLIAKELDASGIGYALLTGATRNREAEVNRFQQEADVRVFLVSLKAGGTGLNLTAADYVYLVDPWWNPAVEAQAIDRAYRIGQQQHVVAVRLICPDTVEEKIVQLQERKKELTEKLVAGQNPLLTLGRDGLLDLLG